MRPSDLWPYVGNIGAYAVQQPDGSYRPVRAKVTDDLLAEHLGGRLSIGSYTLAFDKARYIVFDDDTKNLALANRLKAEASRRGLSAGVEYSGAKGYHVWVLFEDYEPAVEVRRLASAIADAAGFKGEVFPKQSQAQDLGNLVKLPGGVHAKTKQRSRFIGPEPKVNTHASFETALADVPAGQSKADESSSSFAELPCLDSIQTVPLREGERHETLFYYAVRLRQRGLGDAQVEACLRTLIDPDELDRPGEFESILEDSAKYQGVDCSKLQADRRCPPELCVQTRPRGWAAQRPGEVRYADDGKPVVFTVHHGEGNVIELRHPDVKVAKATLREREKDGN